MSGHGHIDWRGRFRSDKYPLLDTDKIVLSFKDPLAHRALRALATDYRNADHDLGLAEDIDTRLATITKP